MPTVVKYRFYLPLRELNLSIDGDFIFGSDNSHSLVHVVQLSFYFDSLVEELFLQREE